MRRRARWFKRQREEEERIKDSDMFKVVEEVFDSITMGHIYKLIKRGILWELKGVVSTGKEARIYWGVTKNGEDLAVKIYLTVTSEFRKSIKKYIIGDPRLEEVWGGNIRRLIYEWARKECRNLKRLWEKGVRVPRPYGFEGNVLVMEFLGEKGYRAPLLVEVGEELDTETAIEFYRDIISQIETMVCKAKLVHADLSEYNIIVWRERTWIIDVAQAVHLEHPYAFEFLQRDLDNIHRYFSRIAGIEESLEEAAKPILECLG